MLDWISSLTTLQQIFFIFASIGGILFVIRVTMMFIGLDGDADGDADIGDADGDLDLDGGDADVDMDHGDHQIAHANSDLSFSLLSFQGLMAFFMMFGLVGLAMSRGSGYGPGLSLAVATGAGLLTVWIISQMFKGFSKMQTSGTLNLKNAVGEEGSVYLTIKEGSAGKVRVSVQGHLKVMEAVSNDKTEIPTGALVKVIRVVNDNVLVVEKI